jgi:hypothetical protein
MSAVFGEVIGIGSSALLGGFVSAYFTYRFTECRDRRKRLDRFASIMEQAASEADANWEVLGFGRQYIYKVPSLRFEAGQIARDIPEASKVRFDDLMDAACRYTEAEANAQENKRRISDAMRAVSKFIYDT